MTTGNQVDFARAQGWQKSYVTALKKEGRMVFTEAGLVDFEASLERIKATAGAPERAAPAVQGKQYSDSQDRERFYVAELKRLEYEERVGTLLSAAEVRRVIAEAGGMFRRAVERWPDTIAPQINACDGNEHEIKSLLLESVERVLSDLSDRLAAAVKSQP